MNNSRKKRIEKAISDIQDVRMSLDKEANKAMSSNTSNSDFVQIDDAIYGLLMAERSMAKMFDKNDWLAGLTLEQKEKYGFQKNKDK